MDTVVANSNRSVLLAAADDAVTDLAESSQLFYVDVDQDDLTPFIGPVLMRVRGRGHAAAPCWAASRGVSPWRTECGL